MGVKISLNLREHGQLEVVDLEDGDLGVVPLQMDKLETERVILDQGFRRL